jgi:hypothetical protein
MRTIRSNDFYRLLENWEYGVIDGVDFQIKAIEMGMPTRQIDELIKWLENENHQD